MHRDAIVTRSTRVLATGLARLGSVVRGAAFWTAAVLPLAYPVLFLANPVTPSDIWWLGSLVALNALALVLGHGYSGPLVAHHDATE